MGPVNHVWGRGNSSREGGNGSHLATRGHSNCQQSAGLCWAHPPLESVCGTHPRVRTGIARGGVTRLLPRHKVSFPRVISILQIQLFFFLAPELIIRNELRACFPVGSAGLYKPRARGTVLFRPCAYSGQPGTHGGQPG